ncbi:MAG TPA: hypothetical protein VET90_08615 [Candidatus Binatus sp.]|nr:hypothetical protein [Candidatus Binatus sp.]
MNRPDLQLLRRRRLLAALAVIALGLPVFGVASPALAQPSAACAAAVTATPTGPATVSTKDTAFGKVLEIGAGAYEGCSLYLLTSDQLRAIDGRPFACGNGPNAIGLACDTVLWPALLTLGSPIAGPGVNPTMLGTVTRTDLPGLPAVQQVTYAGHPLYRFFLDETSVETDGADLFDPVTSPTGIWYLVSPRGVPAPGRAHLGLETAPLNGSGDATVLAVSMDHGFVLLPDGSFPVYTLSTDGRGARDKGACGGECAALYWPPVLTSGRPDAGPGVDQRDLGTTIRPDGTEQVTYRGQPLYLFENDAYIPTLPYNGGTAGINGSGLSTPWGEFQAIQLP